MGGSTAKIPKLNARQYFRVYGKQWFNVVYKIYISSEVIQLVRFCETNPSWIMQDLRMILRESMW